MSVLIDINDIEFFCEILRRAGKSIALTNGSFDLVHFGHVNYLNEAKKMADCLIVGINSDASVKQYKSDKRPIISEGQRAMLVDNLKAVDYVVIFSETTADNLIEKVKPDFYVKGGDYTEETLPETETVKKYGGKIKFIKMTQGCSTTNIINKILDVYAK